MKFEQVLELVKAVSESKVTTLKYEEGDTKLMIRTGEQSVVYESVQHPVGQSVSGEVLTSVHIPENTPSSNEEEKVLEGNVVISPLVGTFYSAPSEEAEHFVKVGDQVKKGQTLAIVEAMKLMNEIESDYDGEVVDILVENASVIEYGQPLFVIK